MSNYTQWRQHADAGKIKKITWICGKERVLVEEIIDVIREHLNVSDLDYASLVAGVSEHTTDIWSAANQYPLDPQANRMVLVRDANKIKKWYKLEEWLENSRLIPNVYLVLVSNEEDYASIEKDGKKGPMLTHVSWIRDSNRGDIVKCSPLNDTDIITWVQKQLPLDAKKASFLLSCVDKDLRAAKSVLAKLRMCSLLDPDESLIEKFCDESPADSIVDYIVLGNKRSALNVLEDLHENEYSAVIGRLDNQLDLMALLNKCVKQRMPFNEIRPLMGSKSFLLEKFVNVAKYYDSKRISQCRQYMAIVDDSIRSGSREGTLELLISLW